MMEALYRGKKLKERVIKVSLYTHDGGPTIEALQYGQISGAGKLV
jgi:hypothetical protein